MSNLKNPKRPCYDAWPAMNQQQRLQCCIVARVERRRAFQPWDEIPVLIQIELRQAMEVKGFVY